MSVTILLFCQLLLVYLVFILSWWCLQDVLTNEMRKRYVPLCSSLLTSFANFQSIHIGAIVFYNFWFGCVYKMKVSPSIFILVDIEPKKNEAQNRMVSASTDKNMFRQFNVPSFYPVFHEKVMFYLNINQFCPLL